MARGAPAGGWMDTWAASLSRQCCSARGNAGISMRCSRMLGYMLVIFLIFLKTFHAVFLSVSVYIPIKSVQSPFPSILSLMYPGRCEVALHWDLGWPFPEA